MYSGGRGIAGPTDTLLRVEFLPRGEDSIKHDSVKSVTTLLTNENSHGSEPSGQPRWPPDGVTKYAMFGLEGNSSAPIMAGW
mmetsp:Transcript_902/g.1523  ORF Transcript_902/g.1523 Transcript_902/m.1523 type:complete len:82 (-) Transcript_902:368-613(-)